MKNDKKLYYVKALFLGESGVGKTSIINRLIGKGFKENTPATVGNEAYSIPNIKCLIGKEDDSQISINIWDTAGQERYRAVCKGIVQKADIIIFVRDNNKENFESWFHFVNNIIDIESKKIIYCLNKTDLMTEEEKTRLYDELDSINCEKGHNATIQCVSSKNSDGIFNLKSLIQQKAREIISKILQKNNYIINIILIGSSGVGKSSLINRIINDVFKEQTLHTFSNEIKPAKIDLKNHSSINYKYIDICGQERYTFSWMHFLDNVDNLLHK